MLASFAIRIDQETEQACSHVSDNPGLLSPLDFRIASLLATISSLVQNRELRVVFRESFNTISSLEGCLSGPRFVVFLEPFGSILL